LAKHCKQLALIGEAGNAEKVAKLIAATKPDLILLNIQMSGDSGFDMLNSLVEYLLDVSFCNCVFEYRLPPV
jgi:two-component system LytT family response regulator